MLQRNCHIIKKVLSNKASKLKVKIFPIIFYSYIERVKGLPAT